MTKSKEWFRLNYPNKFDLLTDTNFLKNIHTRWKNHNNSFKFTTVFENNTISNTEPYMREIIYYESLENNNKGKNIAIIFTSDFMLNRIAASKHLHIDATFIHPPEFMQILVILYIDIINNIIAPGAFIIMNKKTQDLYERVFKSIKYYITSNNIKALNIKTIALDYEIAMQNEIRNIFPEIKIVGCLFLFKQSLLRHLRNLGLYNKEYKIKSNEVIKSCGSLPFTIHKNPKVMNILLEQLKKELGSKGFSFYFEEEWAQFIIYNGILDYHNVSKDFRSNSYIENYNKSIKQILGKHIFLIIINK